MSENINSHNVSLGKKQGPISLSKQSMCNAHQILNSVFFLGKME